MKNTEEFNNWVDANIPVIPTEEWCHASHTLDWIRQKGSMKSMTYTSHPDEKQHAISDGLWEVIEFIDKAYSNLGKQRETFLSKLWELWPDEDAPNSLAEEKLHKIKEIINQ